MQFIPFVPSLYYPHPVAKIFLQSLYTNNKILYPSLKNKLILPLFLSVRPLKCSPLGSINSPRYLHFLSNHNLIKITIHTLAHSSHVHKVVFDAPLDRSPFSFSWVSELSKIFFWALLPPASPSATQKNTFFLPTPVKRNSSFPPSVPYSLTRAQYALQKTLFFKIYLIIKIFTKKYRWQIMTIYYCHLFFV